MNAVVGEFLRLANPNWTKTDYRSLSREGYQKNIVAYHCISRISQCVAGIPYTVKIGDKEAATGNKFLSLLARPNPSQSYKTFMRVAVMHRLIGGNTYIHGNKVSTGRIMELTLLRPDRVTVEVNAYDEPYRYSYTKNGKQEFFYIEPLTLESEVLQIKEPNPLCDIYGMSPITAASMSIDQHNESGEWNKKLLENSARPPGVLAMKDRGDNTQILKPKQLREISNDLNKKFAGFRNAGKIPVTSFDMEWRSMGMSPTDMDWINGKSSTARDICLAFGYPPFLLGMPEGATYNNVTEAKLALYEETVIPLTESMYSELSYFLSYHTGLAIEIVPDLDQVSALQPRREIARTNARLDVGAGIITINEGRQEIGYDEVEGGDEIMVPSNKLPLNFDLSNMNEQKFTQWLEREGFTKETASEITKIAYKQ